MTGRTHALLPIALLHSGSCYCPVPPRDAPPTQPCRLDAPCALAAQVSELVSRFGSAGPVSEHQVLEAIDRGVADDGGNGLHWVLDPIDGTKAGTPPARAVPCHASSRPFPPPQLVVVLVCCSGEPAAEA